MGFTSYCLSLFLYIMSSYLMRYSVLYELNSLDACWIAVDLRNTTQQMQEGVGLLDTDVMPMFMIIALDIIITLRFSINCSAVICSPTVIHAILREAISETYGPRVSFSSYQSPSLYYCFTFLLCLLLFTLHLYTKNIIYHLYKISLS